MQHLKKPKITIFQVIKKRRANKPAAAVELKSLSLITADDASPPTLSLQYTIYRYYYYYLHFKKTAKMIAQELSTAFLYSMNILRH